MQPLFELKLHPIDLSRHGLNPYGDSVYRVVWADTRKSKVFCKGKFYTLPRYAHGSEAEAGGNWVLEKWQPPEVVVGMNREQYEAFLSRFPDAAAEAYPERGEYELSRIFNEESGPFARNVDEVALHKQLYFHEWKHEHMTDNDRAQEILAIEEAKEVVEDQKFDALFDEAREENQCLN